MEMSYFPGCTLKNKATVLDCYARECAKAKYQHIEKVVLSAKESLATLENVKVG